MAAQVALFDHLPVDHRQRQHIFGDLVSFDSIPGSAIEAVQAFVATKLGVDASPTLQISTEGKLNAAGGLANADVSIKLEGVDWSHTSINSLISGADPTIKIDNNNS